MQHEQRFVSRLYDRVDALRREAEDSVRRTFAQTGNAMQARLERDVAAYEQSGLLAALNAVESGLCFGRIDFRDGGHHHIGRVGIRVDDEERTPLLIDWRAPVARPFYLATGHTPMGLRRRRHLTTEGREVLALHDEILDLDDTERTGYEAHDADALLLAALDAARTGRMHDIVQTIQAEQDEIIRAPHQGVRVVEGGPGTGKTAVALHRAAYLLYEHRELLARRAVLILGPNPAFLDYIGEVLPSLGETGVLLATVGELFPGVAATGTESEQAAAVKGRAGMAEVIAQAVRDRQALPDPVLEVDHDGDVLLLDRETVRTAREKARATGLPHNAAREHFEGEILNALTDQLAERIGADPFGGPNLLEESDVSQLRSELDADPAYHAALDTLWPLLTPQRLVADLLEDPYGRLPDPDAQLIRRPRTAEWTPADVPLLDEAAELLGEDERAARAAAEAERRERIAYAQGVLDVAYASRTYEFEGLEDEDSEVLGVQDIMDAERMAERHEEADHRTAAERAAADRTWAFGHIIVDEAQELSPMAWRLLMRRSPTRSMTLVGDPAQSASPASPGSWSAALEPHVGDRYEHIRLGVNYRTPTEIMEYAAAARRAEEPGFEPPRSVRSTGVAPWEAESGPEELPRVIAATVAREMPGEGRLAVIAPAALHPELAAALPEAAHGPGLDLTRPVALLDARQAKGLEFDTVLVVEPERFGTNDRYVAFTRATQRLGVIRVR
ncbi:AAA family ATPase [Streptomyces sp. JJ36]|uniref:HelD family protein n=1 Tax=Streptomyces sp. JJ36 TaxID=2736645 RepID=UPI001F32D739|nr:AAA family ATPase [Streptomyces sp. JJ36]MCF6521874.1 AAA family ATPase [Streptomyces sp. JJ36]